MEEIGDGQFWSLRTGVDEAPPKRKYVAARLGMDRPETMYVDEASQKPKVGPLVPRGHENWVSYDDRGHEAGELHSRHSLNLGLPTSEQEQSWMVLVRIPLREPKRFDMDTLAEAFDALRDTLSTWADVSALKMPVVDEKEES